jgi:hypothetical protein
MQISQVISFAVRTANATAMAAAAWLWPATALAQAPEPAPVASPAAPPAAAPAATAPLWQPPPAAAPSPVEPDTNTSTMNNNLTLFAALGYGYGYGTGYGLGARYQIVFADHVLKLPPGKHDEFGVEFGLDWYHVGYEYKAPGFSYEWSYNEFTPVVGVTWNFWLTDKLALYPKIDFGYRFISWNDDRLNGYDAAVGHLYFQGTGGIVYKVGPVALRAELGWASLRVGAAIPLF